jgi:hypothetical protein
MNTISMANQVQKYLFPTFIIPKFLKFCIQPNGKCHGFKMKFK